MLRKLNGLVLATLLVANAPVMAAQSETVEADAAVAAVTKLVDECQAAGLSQAETVTLMTEVLKTSALPGASLTTQQKKYMRYAVGIVLAAAGVYGLYWLYNKCEASAAEEPAQKGPVTRSAGKGKKAAKEDKKTTPAPAPAPKAKRGRKAAE